jgi:hypothetical protein
MDPPTAHDVDPNLPNATVHGTDTAPNNQNLSAISKNLVQEYTITLVNPDLPVHSTHNENLPSAVVLSTVPCNNHSSLIKTLHHYRNSKFNHALYRDSKIIIRALPQLMVKHDYFVL